MERTAANELELPVSLPTARAGINIMRLDFDVLFEVLWWVRNKKTVSRLMRTCRTLYSKGVPLLLDSFVHLDNHRLQSFCLFMTADSSRCQYLRSVYFNFLALCHEPADIDAILGVIQNASNLKRLHLNNETLASDDRFPLAFASLSSVEELVLDTYGKAAADMLADLESPVRHADITFVAGRNQSFPNPTDFVEALQNASKTLKTVVVSNVHWEASTLGLKFPEVVSLTIENYDSIDGEGLMAALPKLRKLCTDHDFVGEDAQRLVINSLDEFQEMRSVSLERQECNGSSWESLDELSGNLHYLYCLGIACPTRKLELRVVEPLRLDWLEVLLSATNNSILEIHCHEIKAKQVKSLVSLLPISVRKLVLFLSVKVIVKSRRRVITCIAKSMRSLAPQITHLDLTIELDDPQLYFNDQLKLEFGTRIAEVIPSLQYICIEVIAGFFMINNQCSWTIERPEDGFLQMKTATRIALLYTGEGCEENEENDK